MLIWYNDCLLIMRSGNFLLAKEVHVQQSKFSIFDPVIAYEHREFYEQIVNELNVILPICNQGKCLAIEISRNPAEQETIRELMQRVEQFRGELLEGTKKLFDQFYQSKESFHRMIQSTVAYVKINLIDRNLLERTCDVRWWALETAFCSCIENFNTVRANLHQTEELIGKYLQDLQLQKQRLSESSTSVWRYIFGRANNNELPELNAKVEALVEFRKHLGGVQVMVNKKSFERFGNSVQVVCSKLGNIGKEKNIADAIHRLRDNIRALSPMIDFACDRLQTINSSYTLYRDLVICDEKGYVIANSNPAVRETVLGLNVADEKWFAQAMQTKDGTEYYAQDLAHSKVEEQLSLVYSTAIRKDGRENNPAIGAMGIYFDFQGEAGIILKDYMPSEKSGSISEGWCSFLTNKDGEVIASSDSSSFAVGQKPPIPRSHRDLEPGKASGSYGVYTAQDGALFSAKTDGYLDYQGLGWSSHLVLPRSDIFRRHDIKSSKNLNMDELLNSKLIPDINKSTYSNVQKDKRALQLISTNGMLFAADLGLRGQSLSPVFEQITKTGDFATNCMEDLLQEMAADALNLNFQTLKLFSKQAIDLIDRNLFERSADIRWWSTDKYFWEALQSPSDEKFLEASERLKVINNSYTMYRNLILADASGKVVACSRPASFNQLREINVSGHDWFQRGVQTQDATEYVVQDVRRSELEKSKECTLIYSGGVRRQGASSGDSIGVLGVLFDWDTEAQNMLEKCLPCDNNGEFIEGSAAFYTNAQGVIIETTDQEHFPVNYRNQQLEDICHQLKAGASYSGFFRSEDSCYIIGSSKTKGYREYEGLGWTAHVLRPFLG